MATNTGAAHSLVAHLAATLEAGAHHNDVAAARWLVSAAPTAAAWLREQGVQLHTMHAEPVDCLGGDNAEAVILHALIQRARNASHVDWRPDARVDALLLRDGCVAGVRVCDSEGKPQAVEAAAVVLATGGIAGLYAHRIGEADSANLALALTAGAWPRDLEFVQFVPVVAHGNTPATLAAGFHLGGVAVDLAGHTSLPGLHAVGEAACSGAHGANLLPGNALLEAVATGMQVGERLRAPSPLPTVGAFHWVELGASLRADHLAALRELMWRVAGPVREAVALRDAWRICAAAAETGWQMQLAKTLLRALRLRKRSLGVHVRADCRCPMS